jgi:hypothetical protein
MSVTQMDPAVRGGGIGDTALEATGEATGT